MPHTTRVNYKSRLISSEKIEDTSSVRLNVLHERLLREGLIKEQLHKKVYQLAQVTKQAVETLDESKESTSLKFSECADVVDDLLEKLDASTIVRRARDTILDLQDRVEKLVEHTIVLEMSLKCAHTTVTFAADQADKSLNKGAALLEIGKTPGEDELENYWASVDENEPFIRYGMIYESLYEQE